MFHPMNLEDYPTHLEDSYIFHLMYLEICDPFDVSGRFVNLYIMVIMKDFLAFLDNNHYGFFMITIIKDILVFLDNGHYGCFIIIITKDLSTFLDKCIKSGLIYAL